MCFSFPYLLCCCSPPLFFHQHFCVFFFVTYCFGSLLPDFHPHPNAAISAADNQIPPFFWPGRGFFPNLVSSPCQSPTPVLAQLFLFGTVMRYDSAKKKRKVMATSAVQTHNTVDVPCPRPSLPTATPRTATSRTAAAGAGGVEMRRGRSPDSRVGKPAAAFVLCGCRRL